MDGVKEEQRPDPLVEIVAGPAEVIECAAFLSQCLDGGALAQSIQRRVALVAAGCDDAGEAAHGRAPPPAAAMSRSATSSSICDNTAARSGPFRASANCAIQRP